MPRSPALLPTERAGRGVSEDERVQDALSLVADLRIDFGERDKLYARIEDAVFQRVSVEIPDNYRKAASLEVKSPLPSHITNTVTAALTVNPFTVQFQPVGLGDSHQQNATQREHFFEASWQRQEQEARRQLFREWMWSVVTKGEGILKTVERSKRAWSDYTAYSKTLKARLQDDDDPEYGGLDSDSKDRLYDARTEEYKRSQPYPIATTDVVPETFYYLKGEDGFQTCAEVKQVPYLATLGKYEPALNAMGVPRSEWSRTFGSGRSLTMTEVWTPDECVYILQGETHLGSDKTRRRGVQVKRFKHGYGDKATRTLRGPYFHALGITTGARVPQYAGLSILFGFLDLFPSLDTLLTIQHQGAVTFGFPAFKRVTPPGGVSPAPFGDDGTEEGGTDVIEAGTIYPYDIQPIEQPRASVDLDKGIGLIRAMLELALPSVVQGVISGDESGYALNQAAHLARLAWDPLVGNAQTAMGDRIGFESWLIEKRIAERVYVWGEMAPRKSRRGVQAGWLGIGPDDLNGVHRYRARLDPETPSNRTMLVRTLGEMVQSGFIDVTDAQDELGENPDEVERAKLLTMLKADPEIQARLKRRVFERLGIADQAKLQGQPGQVDVRQEMESGLGAAGQVFSPGYGMPEQPTPGGSVTGVGPAGAGMVGGIAGMPMQPNLPANHVALPGQQG